MNTAIENAIKFLAEKIAVNVTAPEAMNYSQAALNLAHTLQVLAQAKK